MSWAARALGARLAASGGDDPARLRELGLRLLSRPFAADEERALLGYLAAQRERLAAHGLGACEHVGGLARILAELFEGRKRGV